MNRYFRFFMFVNESLATSTEKARFYVYYSPDQKGDISKSVVFIFTPTPEGNTQVRIAKVKNLSQANSAMFVLSKLLTLYDEEKEDLAELYKDLVPSFVPAYEKKAEEVVKRAKKEEDKKTGRRVIALRREDPDLFQARYPDSCQKKFQPMIVSKEVADTYSDHKKMFFEGRWYVCEPREPDEEEQKVNAIWPGRMHPTIKKPGKKTPAEKIRQMEEYAKRHPYLPCCLKVDQYDKKGSVLREYLESRDLPERRLVQKEESGVHVLTPNKLVPPDRYGELPHNWDRVVQNLGYEKIKKKRREVYPLLRYGVEQTPDSFFHCLELVFSRNYIAQSSVNRKKSVMEVRRKIAKDDRCLVVGLQQFPGKNIEYLKNMLLDEKQYLPPEKFISIAEICYDCNILLFQINSKNPDGEVLLPHNGQPYLRRHRDVSKTTVIIFAFGVEKKQYADQCEIMIYSKDGKMLDFILPDNVVRLGTEIWDSALSVFYTSYIASLYTSVREGGVEYKKYTPPRGDIFDDADAQYVDKNGKLRMIRVDGVCIVTPPLPPLTVRNDLVETPSSVADAQRVIKKYNMEIVEMGTTERSGVWVRNSYLSYAYIPLAEGEKIENIPPAPPTKYDPLVSNRESELKNFLIERKTANILKIYALFTYSINEKFDESNIFVVPGYQYKIDDMKKVLHVADNNVMYRGGRLIVPSEDIAIRLIEYVKSRTLTDKPGIMLLREGLPVYEFYSNISDFKSHDDELLFFGREGVILWLKEKNKNPNEIKEVLDSNTKEAYFFVLPTGKICIIQNVDGASKEKAEAVCDKWVENKINMGYYPRGESSREYKVFSLDQTPNPATTFILKHQKGFSAVLI